MNNKTKTKLIVLAVLIITIVSIITVFGVVLASAAECPDSGTIKTLSYSPSNLSVGMPFNLTYSDAFNNGGSTDPDLRLWLPAGLARLSGNEFENLIDDGMGGGYFTWRLNSSANGTYTIIVTALYESTQCNVTRNITIGTPASPPNLVLNYGTIPVFIAKQPSPITLLIKNTGTGTAYNVTGTTTLAAEGTIDVFAYATILPGDAQTRNFSINTDYCGIQLLSSTVNYKDSAGYSYPPSHTSRNVSVKGSDLVIESFTISDSDVKVGEKVRFNVTVTNNNRNTSINATNAVVRIYRGGNVIGTITLGSIAVGESASGSTTWSASGIGTFRPVAVVDSDQECSNWNNSFSASSTLTIRSSGGGGGGGGGGGTPAPYCGNGICEWGETYENCPQDCKISQNQTQPEEEQPTEETIVIWSNDGMASLTIYKGTKVMLNGNVIKNPEETISLRANGIPYPLQRFYLVRSYEFLPEGITFDNEAEVKIRYHKGEIPETASAFILVYTAKEGRWLTLTSIDNKEAGEVIAKITHLSTFALVSTERPRLTGAAIWDNFVAWTSNNWLWILIAVIVIAIVAIIVHRINRRK